MNEKLLELAARKPICFFFCSTYPKKSKNGNKYVNCEKWEPQLSVELASLPLGGTTVTEFKLYSNYNFGSC